MAGKIDSVPNYSDIIEQTLNEEQQKAADYQNLAGALSPDQAAAYQDTDYLPQNPPAPAPEQQLAEALSMWQNPGEVRSIPASEAKLGEMAVQSKPELSTAGANFEMAQQAPEAFNAMQGAMAGTGLQANMPTPLAPAVAPQQLEQAPQPVEQQLAAQDAERQAVQAEDRARNVAAEKMALQAKHQENIEAAASKRLVEQDQKASSNSSGWAKAALQGLAVGLGEYGRYLTGGKENLATQAIDRAVNEQAAKSKLTMEEKLAGKKLALDLMQLNLRKEELKTDSQLKKAQIAKLNAEAGTEIAKVEQQRKLAALLRSGRGFGAEDLAVLPKDMAEKAVLLPNGQYGLATVNTERLNKGQESITNANLASKGLVRLQELTDFFGNNPAKKVMSREQIAEAQTLAQSLKGQLRLSLLGPGAITDYEHEMLNKIVRDPTAIASLSSANKAALRVLQNKLGAERDYTYRSLGINLPPSVNEQNIAAYKKMYGLTDAQAVERLTKMGKWEY